MLWEQSEHYTRRKWRREALSSWVHFPIPFFVFTFSLGKALWLFYQLEKARRFWLGSSGLILNDQPQIQVTSAGRAQEDIWPISGKTFVQCDQPAGVTAGPEQSSDQICSACIGRGTLIHLPTAPPHPTAPTAGYNMKKQILPGKEVDRTKVAELVKGRAWLPGCSAQWFPHWCPAPGILIASLGVLSGRCASGSPAQVRLFITSFSSVPWTPVSRLFSLSSLPWLWSPGSALFILLLCSQL